MFLGILAGLTTCALWGLTFVAPRAVYPFTTWDLTVARYCIFGLTCIFLMADRRFQPRGIPLGQMIVGLSLGGLGYVGYFVAAAMAVQLSGAAIPPVIIGTMPVFLALIANAKDRSVSTANLLVPLSLITVGVGIVNFSVLNSASSGHVSSVLIGIAASVTALGIWIIYGLANAKIMRGPNPPEGLKWTGLQGIGATIGSLTLLPMTSLFNPLVISNSELIAFVVWAFLMGVAGSWVATWCWVYASRHLPLALAAQLIVAETVFGLVYGFIFEGRGPSLAEAVGAACQVGGVCLSISIFGKNTGKRTVIEVTP